MKKIATGLITISLIGVLAGCSDKEEKVNTTTNTQEKSSQSQQKEQQPVKQATLKESENITNVGGGIPLLDGKVHRGTTSVKDGYLYHMFKVGDRGSSKLYVSIADLKKNKWIVENKELRSYHDGMQEDTESVGTHGTAFSVISKQIGQKVMFLNEKGEVKEVEGYGFVRTSRGDAAYTSTDNSLKLTFENGKTQEFKMDTKVEFTSNSDYIDLDKNVAMEHGKIRSVTLYDLKKGKEMFDEKGQKLKGTEVTTGSKYTMFDDYIISVNSETNSDRLIYLDYMFKDKKLPAEDFITVKGSSEYLPFKDKLVQVRDIEYEGKNSIQYIEYKKAK
ncbi:hypothetical protein LKM01_25145 [Bacillus pacificus]|uniref:hypothetical protein n=1 Tax=Bacillus cereus group TaxID=86661 RepID=UPI001E653A8A|nr:hypothetical protein [Bacillus pacificus]MCC2485082.1 hypothetical protein [Bacillus pacificus]